MRKILIRLKRDRREKYKTQNHFKINNQIRSDEGLAHFLLGNVYLTQRVVDSAKLVIKMTKDDEHFNYIGLGQMDLNDGNVAAAKTKFDLIEDGKEEILKSLCM
jgi:hypothetical protein